MSSPDRRRPDPVATIARAADFAAGRHAGQRRKGAAAEPYVNHLAEVALLLAETAACPDAELVAAGWLHDTVEDTATDSDELRRVFGDRVADLVAEVTDDKSLAKAERKRLQIESAPRKSAGARAIKIADKASNLRALVASPPADWGSARRSEYVEWAEQVVAGCRGVNADLEAAFDRAVREVRASL